MHSAQITVKVSTQGRQEVETRALFEAMVERHAKTEDEYQKMLTQTRASCKAKIPLSMMNSKAVRGENGLVTFTYTKNTQTVAIHAGAAHLDVVEDTFQDALDKFKMMMQKQEIAPMVEGAGEWSEAFRKILLEGAMSQYMDSETVKVKVKSEETGLIETTQALTPQDEEFTAAIAELCHEGSRKLYQYPAWRNKFLQVMRKEFGADPTLVMELSGLTEYLNMNDGEEDWTVVVAPAKAGEPCAKPKPLGHRSGYPRSP